MLPYTNYAKITHFYKPNEFLSKKYFSPAKVMQGQAYVNDKQKTAVPFARHCGYNRNLIQSRSHTKHVETIL
jgi:hypothetical protein